MITATFDKLNYERSLNLADCAKFKDQIAKLESHIARLSDSQLLLDHVDKLQHVVDTVQFKLDKFRISAVAKDETVKALEKELDTLHRAFDIQDRYDSRHSGDSSGSAIVLQAERDKMKSLYYELGKRQSDAHSLTLTLADKSLETNAIKETLKEAVNSKEQMKKQQGEFQIRIQDLEKNNANLCEENVRYQEKNSSLNDMHSRLNDQIEDLSLRLSETVTSSKAMVNEKEKLVFELSSLLYTSQLEVGTANGRVDELKQSMAHMQSAIDQNEQRSASSLNEGIGERKLLVAQLKDAEMLKPQLIMAKKNLADIIQESNRKDQKLQAMEQNATQDVAEARFIAEELQRELAVVQRNAEESQNRSKGLEAERTHALRTLQSTLEAAKALTAKLRDEKDRRVAAEERALKAERLADSLQRAKDHVSSAVLEALHKEKSKSTRLENVIKEIASGRCDDAFNSGPSAVGPGSHSPSKGTASHLPEGEAVSIASVRSSISAIECAVPMPLRPSQSSSSSSSGQCSAGIEHTTPNRFDPNSSSGTERSPLTLPLPLPSALGGCKGGEADDHRNAGSTVSKTFPSHAESSSAMPVTRAVGDSDMKPVARRELRLEAMSFDSPSRTVVDGLTR
jgi:chromosome segregation ATPase